MPLFGLVGNKLHKAAAKGDVDKMRSLLQDGKNPDKRDDDGNTALVLAAGAGHLGAVKALLDGEASINFKTEQGITPLMAAVTVGHAEVVQVLLGSGADLAAAATDDGWTCLHEAAKLGHTGIAQVLIKSGADLEARPPKGSYLKNTPLHVAAHSGHAETVKALLKAGASIKCMDNNNNTPAHMAAWQGHVAALKALLEAGADPNAPDYYKRTPLHCAAGTGQVEMIELLVGAGAKLESGADDTPLHEAAKEGRVDVIRALVSALKKKHGAVDLDVRNKSYKKQTPLHTACEHHKAEAAEVLLELGAYLQAKDGQENTPLHLAKYAPVAEVLLEAGADMKATNRDKRTPLEDATRYGASDNYVLVQLLQKWDKKALKNEEKEAELGRDLRRAAAAGNLEAVKGLLEKKRARRVVNRKDNNGKTALHRAAEEGQTRVLLALLAAGADPTAQTPQGQTPADLAGAKGHSQAVAVLAG